MVDLEQRPPDTVEPSDEGSRKRRGPRRTIAIILAIAAVVVVYAFAFERTDVSLDEITSETRQQQLFRILRALAHPNLIEFENVDVIVSVDVSVPCDGTVPPSPSGDGASLSVDPSCADPGATVVVNGTGFNAGETGILTFIPNSEFAIQLDLARYEADDAGDFAVAVDLPERPSTEPQRIEAITSTNVGSLANFFNPFDAPTTVVTDDGEVVTSPRWSENAVLTWEKIIETVMLALLATTVGTVLAIPFSFLAARNLMRDITTPVINLALTLIAIPIGVLAGTAGADAARAVSEPLVNNLWIEAIALVAIPLAIRYALRWAIPEDEIDPPPAATRAARFGVLLVVAVATILWLIVLSQFLIGVGDAMDANLGALAFLGRFVETLGEILDVVVGLLSALIGAGVFALLAGRLGYLLRSRLPRNVTRMLAVPLMAIAGALIGIAIGAVIDWFFEISSPVPTFWVPLILGAIWGIWIAARAWQRESVNIGLTVYYMARTLFNALRSVEPLVMVIVFVVWVGIGPFAGALALALHTTAALAKLYSEQVESILAGPIEAIRATGATRLQTIVYAVVPQIVPPYISFTMYRWDINVRMSTIIGFAGGGGIGFLLQQNINLLQYQDAAAQMLAIAIVVASMDYISSRLRERLV